MIMTATEMSQNKHLDGGQSERLLSVFTLWFVAHVHYFTELVNLRDGTASKRLQQRFQRDNNSFQQVRLFQQQFQCDSNSFWQLKLIQQQFQYSSSFWQLRLVSKPQTTTKTSNSSEKTCFLYFYYCLQNLSQVGTGPTKVTIQELLVR